MGFRLENEVARGVVKTPTIILITMYYDISLRINQIINIKCDEPTKCTNIFLYI